MPCASQRLDEKVVILLIGEDWNSDPVTFEVLFEALARAASRLVLFVSLKRRLFEKAALLKLQRSCDGLSDTLGRLGVESEARLLVSRKPKEEALSSCLEIAQEFPGAIFCFLWWGLDGPSPSLKERLEGAGLKTALLAELLAKGSVPDEC